MNVLLLTVDSLRADRVSPVVTPASFPAIHASRHFGGISGFGIPLRESDSGVRTLAETLSDAGYAIAGYTDNHFASGSYQYDRGFNALLDYLGRITMDDDKDAA